MRRTQVGKQVTKRGIGMASGGRASVEDMIRVEAQVLLCIFRIVQETGKPARLSRRELADAVGQSERRVHAAIGRLIDLSMLRQQERFTKSGAQLSNAYSLTERGIVYLEGAKALYGE